MELLTDLTHLSVAQKEALIGALWARVATLTATVAERQGHLANNSRNSSKPPSLDRLNKPKPRSLRIPGLKPTGGQRGHFGDMRKRVIRARRPRVNAVALNRVKALKLIDCLNVWRFMTDTGVPWTNNPGDKAVRMPKVKLKVAGGFRTPGGIETFCTLRAYLATLHQQGVNHFGALTLIFQDARPKPRCA